MMAFTIERPDHRVHVVQRFLPAAFLFTGLPMFVYGIISLAGQITSTTPTISAKLDLPHYKIEAAVNFEVNQSDLQKNVIYTLGGLFFSALGAGMQLGMLCPIKVHRIASLL